MMKHFNVNQVLFSKERVPLLKVKILDKCCNKNKQKQSDNNNDMMK